MNATVRDVMTRRFVSVREDASFKEMADMLRRTPTRLGTSFGWRFPA